MTRLIVCVVLAFAGCGGGGLHSGGGDGGHSLAGEVPLKHRPTAVACTASGSPTNDNCMQDTDCASGGVCSCWGNTFAPQLHPSANS